MKLIPILCGIIAGYATSLVMDVTGFTASVQASFDPGALQNWTGAALISMAPLTDKAWLAMPAFVMPEWKWEAVLFIVPVAIAPAIEHFGDVLARLALLPARIT